MKKGFSLVELSIVLIIIGLLVEGVTSRDPFTTEQAYKIDKKIDNSLPQKGIIKASKIWEGSAWSKTECVSSGKYKLSEKTSACYLLISGKKMFDL